MLPPLDELVVQCLLTRRRDIPQCVKQLSAVGDMPFHHLRLCQQSLTQIVGQRQIRASAEESVDNIEAAAVLLVHPLYRLLAEERNQGRIEVLLLEADMGAGRVPGAQAAGELVEAATECGMILPESFQEFREGLFHPRFSSRTRWTQTPFGARGFNLNECFTHGASLLRR
jgi:hypothetical protein